MFYGHSHILMRSWPWVSGAVRKKFRSFLPYILILPTAAFVALFTAWPVLFSIYQSFFRQRMNIAKFREPTFIGVENYINLFNDPYFIQVIKNTLLYVLGTVPISVMLGFLFALLVNRKIRGIGFLRLAFFHPMVMPMVSAATIWLFFFTPEYGLFNSFSKIIWIQRGRKLDGESQYGIAVCDHCGDLEELWLLHDLLSGWLAEPSNRCI